MDFAEANAFLDARIGMGMKPGLERIRALTDILDRPQDKMRIVSVSGTNGKFSVARMVTSILTELGLTVGTYTSPHLESITERFAFCGEPVTDIEFAKTVTYLAPFLELVLPLTYFETLTAMAFEMFFDRAVHAAVFEAGLGGEYDATNVANAEVAVITRVELDHVVEFGGDLERAAWEKAGIIKEGSIAITGVEQPELLKIVEQRAAERGVAGLWRLDQELRVEDRRAAVGGQVVTLSGHYGTYDELFLPLYGEHQATNAALAVGAGEAFVGEALDGVLVASALGATTLPGRFEVLRRHPLVVCDGGHNPDSARAVMQTLGELQAQRRLFCLAMLDDKLVEETLAILAAHGDQFFVAAPQALRAAPPDRLAKALLMAEVNPAAIFEFDSVDEALGAALDSASPEDLVFIYGSFYTAGQARARLR